MLVIETVTTRVERSPGAGTERDGDRAARYKWPRLLGCKGASACESIGSERDHHAASGDPTALATRIRSTLQSRGTTSSASSDPSAMGLAHEALR